MPKNVTLYRIFIASPSDVSEERDVIRSVISELSLLFRNRGIILEPIGWETHTYPAVGIDAQAVINSQIDDDFDIFIGVLWAKFGMPTSRYDSGTVEEFEKAFQRYTVDPQNVSILFYFKNKSLNIDDINPDQISKVKGFKSEIGSRGVKYGTFSAVDEFERILRLNLGQLLNDLISSKEKTITTFERVANEIKTVIEPIEKSDDLAESETGYFELLEEATLLMDEIHPIITNISEQITNLGSAVTSKTSEINSLTRSAVPVDISKEAKRIIDAIARDMDKFNLNVGKELPILEEKFNQAIKSYNEAFIIYNTFVVKQEDKENLIKSIQSLHDGFSAGLDGISLMKEAIEKTPKITTKYTIARNNTIKVLINLIENFQSNRNLSRELLETIMGSKD